MMAETNNSYNVRVPKMAIWIAVAILVAVVGVAGGLFVKDHVLDPASKAVEDVSQSAMEATGELAEDVEKAIGGIPTSELEAEALDYAKQYVPLKYGSLAAGSGHKYYRISRKEYLEDPKQYIMPGISSPGYEERYPIVFYFRCDYTASGGSENYRSVVVYKETDVEGWQLY